MNNGFRKHFCFLSIVLLFLSSSCNSATNEVIEDTTNTIATTMSLAEENEIVIDTDGSTSEILASGLVRTEDTIYDAWQSRLEFNGNGNTVIPEIIVNDESILINDEYSDIYDTLVSQLEACVDKCSDEYKKMITVTRSDNRIISMRVSSGNYVDGFVLTTEGDLLNIDDIIIDRNGLVEYLKEYISSTYVGIHSEYSDDDIVNYFLNEDYSYYLDVNSLAFVFKYETQFGDAKKEIHIPYELFADYFNPRYLPGDGDMFGVYCEGIFDQLMRVDGSAPSINNIDYSYIAEDSFVGSFMVFSSVDGTKYLWINELALYWDLDYEVCECLYDISEGSFDLVNYRYINETPIPDMPTNNNEVSDFLSE